MVLPSILRDLVVGLKGISSVKEQVLASMDQLYASVTFLQEDGSLPRLTKCRGTLQETPVHPASLCLL